MMSLEDSEVRSSMTPFICWLSRRPVGGTVSAGLASGSGSVCGSGSTCRSTPECVDGERLKNEMGPSSVGGLCVSTRLRTRSK